MRDDGATRSSPRRTTSPVFQRWATRVTNRAGEGAATAHPDEEVASRNSRRRRARRASRDDGSSTARCGWTCPFVDSHERHWMSETLIVTTRSTPCECNS